MKEHGAGGNQQSTDESIDVKRRRLMQASAAVVGTALAGHASAGGADEDCEQVLPDVSVVNADDRPRTVDLAVDRGPGTTALRQSRERLEPGARREIESVGSAVQGRRLTATVDGYGEIAQELSSLGPERFRQGVSVRIGPEETTVETLHVDLPPELYARYRRRCGHE